MDQITLYNTVVGSRLYGLSGPDSDTDTLSVYVSKNKWDWMGMDVNINNEVVKKNESVSYGLRKFFQLLRKGSTNAIEALHAQPENITEKHLLFERIIAAKHSFVHPYTLYKSVSGYLLSERRLALGERTGLLGSKRKMQLEKHGFSPKNVCNLLRLAYVINTFLKTEEYLACVKNTPVFNKLISIKFEPEKWKLEMVKKEIDIAINEINQIQPPDKNYKPFNIKLANDIIVSVYEKIFD